MYEIFLDNDGDRRRLAGTVRVWFYESGPAGLTDVQYLTLLTDIKTQLLNNC